MAAHPRSVGARVKRQPGVGLVAGAYLRHWGAFQPYCLGFQILGGHGLRRRLEPWKRVSGKNRLGLRRRARAAASQSEENQCEKSPAHRLTLDSKPSER